ncbi:MAG: class I SAM-dependent methyltransferase [Acidobacteriaceae bacterium]|nr:class I SAM-dependent methyltransferase [Acidobacteriaceae bacterium]MBV9779797.1 class I SAM-dependent methyltransferase [Acidobacteriaceae bacterium]
MHPAFATWEDPAESLESVENRIHDGVPKERLRTRAQAYVNTFARLFPWSLPGPGGRVMEIGSGLGYIMEAAVQKLNPSTVVGLDVSASMIENAKRRLARDGVETTALDFRLYDGVEIPYEDNSFDFVYSAATIQHIPKAYAYNLLFEIARVLKRAGFADLHFVSHSLLPDHLRLFPLKQECLRQIRNEVGHWHVFYSHEELLYVLLFGIEVGWISVQEENRSLWAIFRKDREVDFCNETTLTCQAGPLRCS